MKQFLRFCTYFFILGIILPSSPLQAETEDKAVAARSLATILGEIQEVWEDTFAAVKAGEDAVVSEKVHELERLRDRAGFQSLADYSIELLAQGESRYKQGDREAAIFYLRMAELLSPYSPRVALRSLRLIQVTDGLGAVLSSAGSAVLMALGYPEMTLRIVKGATYPLLWALTIGLYVAYILLFLHHVPDILRSIAQRLPGSFRGFGAPVVTVLTLLIPCALGPIACLATWAIFSLLLLPERRWMAFCAGVTIALWGTLIPIRENVGKWLADANVQTMLRVVSGEFGRADRESLAALVREREEDGVAWYVYGQVLKQIGDFEAAELAFAKADTHLGKQGYTLVEQGTLAFLKGDSRQAKELFDKADKRGMSHPGYYFNRSKVSFDLMDTAAAREEVVKARDGDPLLVRRLRAVEEVEGIHSQRSVADVPLPTSLMLGSALFPYPELEPRIEAVAKAIVPGFSPVGITGLGLLVFFLSLIVRGKGTKRYSTYYRNYENSFILYAFMALLPGGLWVRSGRPALAFFSLSTVVLLLLPVVGWPPEVSPVVELVPGFVGLYLSFLGVLFLTVAYVAYQTSEVE